MKERKSFWCSGTLCGYDQHPVSKLAQELKGKSLCKNCYDAGLKLRMEATVYRIKQDLLKEVK